MIFVRWDAWHGTKSCEFVVTSKTWKWKFGYNAKHQGENVKGFLIRIEHKNIDLLF
jgi:hypothetical protein